jgi:hypothetical protein
MMVPITPEHVAWLQAVLRRLNDDDTAGLSYKDLLDAIDIQRAVNQANGKAE